MLWSPAFQSCLSSRNRMAPTIWVVWVRLEPLSGKSETSKTSGSPSPLYSMPVHEDEGSAVISPPSPPSPSSSPPQPVAMRARDATSNPKSASKLRFLNAPPPSQIGCTRVKRGEVSRFSPRGSKSHPSAQHSVNTGEPLLPPYHDG